MFNGSKSNLPEHLIRWQLKNLVASQETEESCKELREFLGKIDTFILSYTIRSNSSKQDKGDLLDALKEGSLDKDKVIGLNYASLAIGNGKIQFFNILINAYPSVICLSKTSFQPPIYSPLMCAIDTAKVVSVKAVLENEHFISHEYNFQDAHKEHVENSLNYAIKSYPSTMSTEEQTIIRLLQLTVNIRLPLNSNIRNSNLDAIRETFESSICRDFEKNYKTEYVDLVKSCIKFYRNYCKSSDKEEEVEEMLKAWII